MCTIILIHGKLSDFSLRGKKELFNDVSYNDLLHKFLFQTIEMPIYQMQSSSLCIRKCLCINMTSEKQINIEDSFLKHY